MQDALTIDCVPPAVLEVVRRLQERGHQAWLVGGAVRDLLRAGRERPAEDWDIATSARPRQVMQTFEKVIPTGVKHGTVTVLSQGEPVEVTTFRGEGKYSDARRPDEVEFLEEVDDDLARRDFTMNAIAWDPFTGRMRDPFGGMRDLEAGVIRAVRDPLERFTEDGLRPMRAIRLACALELTIEEETLKAIPAAASSFRKVAVERVRQELEKILDARLPSSGFGLLAETGLASLVLPELAPLEENDWNRRLRAMDEVPPGNRPIRLAALLASSGERKQIESSHAPILRRLRFPKATISEVGLLVSVSNWREVDPCRPADLRRVLARVGADRVEAVAALWRALARGEAHGSAEETVERLCSALLEEAGRNPPLEAASLALTGKDVMRVLGLGAGPEVGQAISYLLDLVIEDPSRNRPETLKKALEGWRQA